jgi:hypothetical protein
MYISYTRFNLPDIYNFVCRSYTAYMNGARGVLCDFCNYDVGRVVGSF